MAQQKIQLRKLRDFGDNISDTFQFIRQEFKPLLTSFVLIAGLFIIATAIFAGITQKNAFGILEGLSDRANGPNEIYSYVFSSSYWLTLFFTLISTSAMRTVIAAYMKLYDDKGESPTVSETWNVFIRNFPLVVIYSIPQFIIIGIGMVLCVAPGIYFWVVFMPLPFLIINENLSFGDIFNRSFYLVKENFWISLGIYLVGYIIFAVISSVIGIVIGIVFGVGAYFTTKEIASTAGIVTSVMSIVQYIFYIVFFVCVGLQYYNLVELKDATGLSKRLDEMGGNTISNDSNEGQY